MTTRLESKAFPQGGFYIMRHGDGHKHNSRLSFELFAGDKSFIIDPGSYIYTADREMRNLFRSTRYHNTVVVDGKEQNRFNEDELFRMKQDAAVKMNRWVIAENGDKGYVDW
jgi:uncharacterized heparinase superfamily protein